MLRLVSISDIVATAKKGRKSRWLLDWCTQRLNKLTFLIGNTLPIKSSRRQKKGWGAVLPPAKHLHISFADEFLLPHRMAFDFCVKPVAVFRLSLLHHQLPEI
ncbi:hypothetical protein LXL04_018463 [Taraxacum kok-saghyz]